MRLRDWPNDWRKKGIQGIFRAGLIAGMVLVGGALAENLPPVPVQGQFLPAHASAVKNLQPLLAPAASPASGGVRWQLPASVKQGEVLTVNLPGWTAMDSAKQGGAVLLAGRKARVFLEKNGDGLALVPVSVFQKPGRYAVSLLGPAGNILQSAQITIVDGRYQTQNVTVSKSTEGLQPLPGELEAIQALKDTVSPLRYWDADFISPTPQCQNSPFGVKRLHNGVPTGDYHKGVDLRSPAGQPIRAINGGKVQIAQMFRLHGGTVGIDHGWGVESVYIHMSRLGVKPGEVVQKGDVIGYVGATGFATGPHLHWGLYVSGLPVNPNQWIPQVPRCH